MKRLATLALCFLLCIPLSACAPKSRKYTETYFDYFDSFAELTVYAKSADEWEDHLNVFKNETDKYHRLLDIYNSYEETVNLHTLNNTNGEGVTVSEELFEFLCEAKRVYTLTGGYTSISIGTVTSLWKTAIKEQTLPDTQALNNAAMHVDISSIELNEETLTVHITDPHLRLDAGAIGKGYAAKRIQSALIENGCESFLINLGGTICTYGEKPDGESWRGGIQSPDGENTENISVRVSDMALSTSGSYHRGFELDGVTYHHIIDPTTLMPKNTFTSVSVLCKSSTDADALSTALFCMPLDEGQKLIESLNDTEAMWILFDGTSVTSKGFVKK